MNKILIILAVIIGIILLLFAAIYFVDSAKSLPSFMPGYDAMDTKHHYKHGIGSLILGLACFAFAWFQSGKKSPEEKK